MEERAENGVHNAAAVDEERRRRRAHLAHQRRHLQQRDNRDLSAGVRFGAAVGGQEALLAPAADGAIVGGAGASGGDIERGVV